MTNHPRTFLLDENMPRKVLTSLRREGFNATRVYDAELRSQPDAVLFRLCSRPSHDDHHLRHRLPEADNISPTTCGYPRPSLLSKRYLGNRLASAVLNAATLLDRLDISNRVYQLDPDGLEEEL